MKRNTHRSVWLTLAAALLLSPASAQSAEVVTYFHDDALGSPVAATNQDQEVVWTAQYRPYGEHVVSDEQSSNNDQWYTGHKHDQESGLTYMGARYYDPVIGRFMGMDPAGVSEADPHTFNRYAYGNNNPYRYIDPDGRAICAGLCMGLAAGALALWNMYDTATSAAETVQTIANPAASMGAKAMAVGVFVAGVVDPTPGNLLKKAGVPDNWNLPVDPPGEVFPAKLLGDRPSAQDLAGLSKDWGVEVGLVRQRSTGDYLLFSGGKDSIFIPADSDYRLIAHTHPGGSPKPSDPDMETLGLLRQAGGQRSSAIITPDGRTHRFGPWSK